MFNPQTITLGFFIILLIIIIFYPNKKKPIEQPKEEGFNLRRDVLSNVDIFTKHMLLNKYE